MVGTVITRVVIMQVVITQIVIMQVMGYLLQRIAMPVNIDQEGSGTRTITAVLVGRLRFQLVIRDLTQLPGVDRGRTFARIHGPAATWRLAFAISNVSLLNCVVSSTLASLIAIPATSLVPGFLLRGADPDLALARGLVLPSSHPLGDYHRRHIGTLSAVRHEVPGLPGVHLGLPEFVHPATLVRLVTRNDGGTATIVEGIPTDPRRTNEIRPRLTGRETMPEVVNEQRSAGGR